MHIQRGHKMLTNEEKTKLVLHKISSLDFHINSVEKAILDNHEDVPGKPTRAESLASLNAQKQLMEQLLTDLA